MKSWLRSLLLLTCLSFSGCSFFTSKLVIEIPPRPAYEQCPEKPDVQGRVVGSTIVLEIADAVTLRDWITAYQACAESNRVRSDGHIEKLENRLKAIRR